MLTLFGMQHAKPAPTPALAKPEQPLVPFNQPDLFRKAVGSLLYLAKCTRPDLASLEPPSLLSTTKEPRNQSLDLLTPHMPGMVEPLLGDPRNNL